MALSIVSNVAGKVSELLIKEVNFLLGVEDELRSLRDEFDWFKAFLKDADASIQGGNERAKLWVNQVREVAYDTEDIIDTYIFEIHQQRQQRQGFFSNILTTCVARPGQLAILHDLGNKIGNVKRRAEEISANRSKYGIESFGATSSDSLSHEARSLPLSWKKQTPVVEEVDVIGFDEDVKALVQLLLGDDERRARTQQRHDDDEGTHTQQRRAVISIVGMGGLGKTTLANKVFSNPRIKQHFTCHAWVHVSQVYRDRELVESIAEQLMTIDKVTMKLSDEKLKKKVYEHLKERRYLVVLDDVWTRGAWDDIKKVLPEMMDGSKVLLTTRNRDVALHADRQSPPFDLKLLGEEESWELFCKKAIPTKCSEHCPPNLETIGREMVARCGGLPLAIVVLGGLVLRKEQSEEEWRKLLKSVIWQLREGEDQISKILALSYHHLPYYMKPCFLYFAMFPEDSPINAKHLRLKWIAEGFIEARDEETMEEVAEEYLEELVHRSLIQLAERNPLGGIKTCRIHDLLLDLAVSEAKGTNFLRVFKNNSEGITLQRTRRLALHGGESMDIARRYPTGSTLDLSLRTMIVFASTMMGDESMAASGLLEKILLIGLFWLPEVQMDALTRVRGSKMGRFVTSMKLLRVIDLKEVEIILPDAIGELVHLRYLNLGTGKRLPSSIGELTNLQTLKFEKLGLLDELPSGVWKLQTNLRHLEYKFSFSIKGLPSADSLPNLQALSNITAGKWLLHKGLEKMTSLRKLGVSGVTTAYAKALSDSLGKLNNLNKLKLNGREIPTSMLMACHHKHLRVFHLDAHLERLPDSTTQCLLTNLTKLTLWNSKLKEDPFVTLEKLDNLQFLRLAFDAFAGEEMVCSEKGFPQLKELHLLLLGPLKSWKMVDEAMPMLRRLEINQCYNLVMLPQGLERITSLQQLTVRYMPDQFNERLRADDAEDWDKIRHIPSVSVYDIN